MKESTALRLAGAVLVIGASMLAIRMPRSAPPARTTEAALQGPRLFDFGRVALPVTSGGLTDTFVLENRGPSPVNVREVAATCGCIAVDVPTRTVEPGAALAVTATLNVSDSGPKVVHVALTTDARAEPVVLELRAHGVWSRRMTLAETAVTVPMDGEAAVRILAYNYDGAAEPDPPQVRSPEGIRVRFDGWRTIDLGDIPRGIPVRFEGTAVVSAGPPIRRGTWNDVRIGDPREFDVLAVRVE